ncbi:MAG: hypothetical protein ACTSSK_14005 [Candidatus Heimdallarchaeota archaeon]
MPSPPIKPSEPYANPTEIAASSITIRWDSSEPYLDYYLLFVNDVQYGGEITENYQLVTGLVAGTQNEFRVMVYDEFGQYNTSSSSLIYTAPPQPTPNYVVNFVGLSDGISDITLTWYAPRNYMSGWYYNIWRKQGSGSYVLVASVPHSSGSSTLQLWTDTPPSTTTEYTYRISCYNANNQPGPYSYWTGKVEGGFGFSFEPELNYILADNSTLTEEEIKQLIDNRGGYRYDPLTDSVIFDYYLYTEDIIYFTEVTAESLRLNWFMIPNATTYHLFIKHTDSSTFQLLKSISHDTCSFEVLGLLANTNYDFYLSAYDDYKFLCDTPTYTITTQQTSPSDIIIDGLSDDSRQPTIDLLTIDPSKDKYTRFTSQTNIYLILLINLSWLFVFYKMKNKISKKYIQKKQLMDDTHDTTI